MSSSASATAAVAAAPKKLIRILQGSPSPSLPGELPLITLTNVTVTLDEKGNIPSRLKLPTSVFYANAGLKDPLSAKQPLLEFDNHGKWRVFPLSQLIEDPLETNSVQNQVTNLLKEREKQSKADNTSDASQKFQESLKSAKAAESRMITSVMNNASLEEWNKLTRSQRIGFAAHVNATLLKDKLKAQKAVDMVKNSKCDRVKTQQKLMNEMKAFPKKSAPDLGPLSPIGLAYSLFQCALLPDEFRKGVPSTIIQVINEAPKCVCMGMPSCMSHRFGAENPGKAFGTPIVHVALLFDDLTLKGRKDLIGTTAGAGQVLPFVAVAVVDIFRTALIQWMTGRTMGNPAPETFKMKDDHRVALHLLAAEILVETTALNCCCKRGTDGKLLPDSECQIDSIRCYAQPVVREGVALSASTLPSILRLKTDHVAKDNKEAGPAASPPSSSGGGGDAATGTTTQPPPSSSSSAAPVSDTLKRKPDEKAATEEDKQPAPKRAKPDTASHSLALPPTAVAAPASKPPASPAKPNKPPSSPAAAPKSPSIKPASALVSSKIAAHKPNGTTPHPLTSAAAATTAVAAAPAPASSVVANPVPNTPPTDTVSHAEVQTLIDAVTAKFESKIDMLLKKLQTLDQKVDAMDTGYAKRFADLNHSHADETEQLAIAYSGVAALYRKQYTGVTTTAAPATTSGGGGGKPASSSSAAKK